MAPGSDALATSSGVTGTGLAVVVTRVEDIVKTIRPWVTFAGCVLVVGVLFWAQAVLVPLALAILLTFVLAPPITRLERWIGRVPAVVLGVTLVFTLLGVASWGLTRQMQHLAAALPGYRANIQAKIADVRGAGKGGTVEKLQETLEDLKGDLGASTPAAATAPRPVVVAPETAAGFASGFGWLSPIVGPLGTASLVVALVMFMLLERRDLRDRLIGLFGQGRLAVTTKAFDEAGSRVSRQLLMQSLVNLVYGIGVACGLYFLGVPYPFLWAALGAALRFIPYVGPVLGAGAPILISLAALEGWKGPLMVVVLFVCLELFTNLVLETVLYAGAAGVSQVALLVSVAFWTWLWGPLGLLLATPLTVCLVVLGKHVPGLEFLGTLMADRPALAPEYNYYQRLLARDQSEAADLVERYIKSHLPAAVYDALLLPALNYAERDRLEGRLSEAEESQVSDSTRELITDAAGWIREVAPELSESTPIAPAPELPGRRQPLRVLGYAANGTPDVLALHMLTHLVEDLPIDLEVHSTRLGTDALVSLLRDQKISALCIADLPPSPPSRTRYVVKRLRAALPDLRILVGRWAPEALADERNEELRVDGATHVARALLDTRDYLAGLLELPRVAVSDQPDIHAA